MTAALRSGYIADMIGKSAEVRHRDLARRKEPIVGVSEYANLEERAIERSRPTPAPTRRSTDMLSTEQRSMISQTADPSALFELLVDAAKKGSYVGELFAALHPEANKVFIPALPRFRWSAAWEELREASEGFKRDTGRSPLVFLVNLGDVSVYKARSEFTHRFLEAGGFEVIDNGGFEHTDAAVRAFLESGATAAVFCGSDQSYIELLARFAPVLREHKPRFLALAGRPGEHAEAWSVLGITHYIYLGCDVLATLKTFQSALGVTP
jgi:methylmalonyl-CoA mutase